MEIEEAIKIIEANWPPENYTMLRLALHKLIEERSKPIKPKTQWQKDYLERLEAAFLEALGDEGMTDENAREALERIKEGGKDESYRADIT